MKLYYPVIHSDNISYKTNTINNRYVYGAPIIKLNYISSMKMIDIDIKSDKLSFIMQIPYRLVRTVLDDLYNNIDKKSTDISIKFNISPYKKIYTNTSYHNLKRLLKTFKNDYFVQPRYIINNKKVTIDELINKLK